MNTKDRLPVNGEGAWRLPNHPADADTASLVDPDGGIYRGHAISRHGLPCKGLYRR